MNSVADACLHICILKSYLISYFKTTLQSILHSELLRNGWPERTFGKHTRIRDVRFSSWY